MDTNKNTNKKKGVPGCNRKTTAALSSRRVVHRSGGATGRLSCQMLNDRIVES